MAKVGFSMSELMDSVQVKNRVIDGSVCVIHDREPWVWGPGETKTLARKAADWFVRKSMYSMTVGDTARDIPAVRHHKLVILGSGKDESDLSDQQTMVPELIDRSNMRAIDLKTGLPMKVVYIDPNTVAGTEQIASRADSITKQTKEHISDRIMDTTVSAVKEIADALPTEVIGDGEAA